MNKIVKVSLTVGVGAVLVAGSWYLYAVYGPKLPIENVLPAQALAYVRLDHPVAHWHRGISSEFWKNISVINIPKVLARNKIPKARIIEIERWRKQAVKFLHNPMTQKFLGKEVAMAVYLHKGVDLKDMEGAYGTVVVLRLLPLVQVEEWLSRFSNEWGGGKITTIQERYRGQSIIHVRVKKTNIRLKYVRFHDLLVIAAEKDKVLNRIIDSVQQKDPSLSQDKNFLLLKAHAYDHADGLAYLNMEGPFSISGFKTYAFSFLPGAVQKYKFIAGFDPADMGPALRRLAKCSPLLNPSLAIAPADVIAYQWGACYDFREAANQIKEQFFAAPAARGQVRHLKRLVQKHTGFNMDGEFLSIFGSEAGGYVTDVDTGGMIPYPRFLAFVKISDQVKAEALLKQLTRTPLGMVRQETYGETNIRYLPLPLGSNMDPSYCFLGDYLLAASSRQLLKKSIDTYKEPAHSLKTDKTFALFGLNSAGGTQSVMFVRLKETARRLRALLDWGNNFYLSQVSAAVKLGQEQDNEKERLTGSIAASEAELKLAEQKLREWKSKSTAEISPEDQALIAGAVANLESLAQDIRERIKTDTARNQDIDDMMVATESQAAWAKLLMFNSQQVLVPLLKGFETIPVLGARVTIQGQVIEMDLMFN